MNRVTGYADINGIALRYVTRLSDRPKMVLVHESGGTLESWDETADILAADWDILTYDWRGAGLSEKILDRVSIDDHVGDLIGLLDHLNWKNDLVIAGAAVGAAIVIKAASTNQSRFVALAVLSPALSISPDMHSATLAAADRVEALGMRATTDPRWSTTWPEQFRDPPERAAAARCRRLSSDPRSFAANSRMLAEIDLQPLLPTLKCPSLFLTGTQSQARSPEAVKADADQVPGSEYDVLESGNFIHAMTPELTANRLNAYFQSQIGSGGQS